MPTPNSSSKSLLYKAFIKALYTFLSIIPMLLGVILLIGIFQNYITTDMLKTLFGFSIPTDIFTGTFFGAISSGHPITSYIIGEELLNGGVTIYAVSAFVLAWVTLGIIQLPAEASIFGIKFTIIKNILTLFSTLIIAYLSVITLAIFQ